MKKFKVLIADAQNEVRRQLVKALKDDQSIEIVGETDNGKEAYELYTDHNPDIVLFELLLPVYDGYTLLEKMQQSAKNSKTMYIIITSINKDILISEALNRGVNYVIMKPFDCNIMAEKIKKVYLRMNEILKENKSMLDYNTDDLSICAKSGTIPQMDTIIMKIEKKACNLQGLMISSTIAEHCTVIPMTEFYRRRWRLRNAEHQVRNEERRKVQAAESEKQG